MSGKLSTALFSILLLVGTAFAEGKRVGKSVAKHADHEVITYKKVKTEKGAFELKLHIFNPKKSAEVNRPCILLIHGGGWNSGEPAKYFSAAKKWASLGLVAISAEYRIRDHHGGNALDSVRDAKSAMRWVRSHAKELKVDPNRIAAQGSSAGGHLAAACATLTSFNEEGEDTSISCLPNALLLKSPVLDNGPGGYGRYKKEVSENWKEFSPFHNVRKGIPPALVSVGTEEKKYLRVEIAKDLKRKMEDLGGRCELIVLEGATHRKRTKQQNQLVSKAQLKFLRSLGFIQKKVRVRSLELDARATLGFFKRIYLRFSSVQ